jgi:Tol biopolymer transport system component
MKNITHFGLILLLTTIVITILISGCVQDQKPIGETRIGSLPSTADILFVSNRDTGSRRTEIYAMDADGGNVTRLTFTNEFHFIMGIDRSRRYIVTSRAEEDTDQPPGLGDEDRRSLWLLDLETKEEKRLTGPKYHAEGDSFSPDGEWIVFLMRVEGEEQLDIYKIRRDGSELTKFTDTKTIIEGDPTWSNDGTKIVFTSLDFSSPDVETPRFLLKTMDTDGKNIKTVYDGSEGVTIPGAWPPGNYDPSWSPDDEWIVFERAFEATGGNFGSGNWHILKVRKDGSEVVDLSLAGGHTDRAEYLPSYSPDGQFIVFGSIYQAEDLKQSHNDIFIMDTDGGSLKRLTHNPVSDMYPVWIPSSG